MHKRTVTLAITVRKQDGTFVARYEVIHRQPGEYGYVVLVTLPTAARFNRDTDDSTQAEAEEWARQRVKSIHGFPDLVVTEEK